MSATGPAAQTERRKDAMSREYVVAKTFEIEEESIVQVEVEGRPVALYHLPGGEFRATSDVCTHGQAFLSEGWLGDEGQVECPLHGGCFDIRTGAPTAPPCEVPLEVYPVRIEGDDVIVVINGN